MSQPDRGVEIKPLTSRSTDTHAAEALRRGLFPNKEAGEISVIQGRVRRPGEGEIVAPPVIGSSLEPIVQATVAVLRGIVRPR